MSSALPTLARDEFEAIRDLVRAETGVALTDAKRMLVQTRLGRRLRSLGLPSFGSYLDLLQSPHGHAEMGELIGAITTHTTHFWREAHHFEELDERVLKPAIAEGRRKLRIWSAACSTGEEPYCLAIAAAERLGERLRAWDLRILATDIDANSLAKGRRGVYDASVLDQRPRTRRWFLKGVREREGLVQVRREIRELVRFRRLNLVEDEFRPKGRFDAIFIRNVLIYFAPETQLQVVKRLAGFLADDGILVLGHAEAMVGNRAGLSAVGRGTFLKARPAS